MIRTTPSDDIQEFLAFMDRLSGGVPLLRAGASAEQIQRLTGLVQKPLPVLYLGYLREFGREDRLIKFADDAYSSIEGLLRFYEAQVKGGLTEVPPNGVVIATQGLSGARSLIYEASKPGEPVVVVNWMRDIERTIAQSFRNLLYRQGFGAFRLPNPPRYAILYNNKSDTLDEALRLGASLGFEPYWFNDAYGACAESEDAWFVCQQGPRDFVMYLDAHSATQRDALKKKFVEKLELKG